MHGRLLYLNRVDPFVGQPVVKVLTGLRRVGKSCLLRLIIGKLKAQGVPEGDILYIDKESLKHAEIATHLDLDQAAQTALLRCESGKLRLFVDEVQTISEWELAIASLSQDRAFDIYISGSNAQLFSGELATRLSGRFVEFRIYPLGFSEFLQFRGVSPDERGREFVNFMRFGGFPGIHMFPLDEEVVFQYVGDIYNTVLLKDIVKRHNVRNVPLLERIAAFLFDNVGNVTTAGSISKFLKSQRVNVGVDTVQAYIGYFLEAMALYRAGRFDLKGRRHLELFEKYYLGEVSLRHAIIGWREADISGILENIVYLELLRRGFKVEVGKMGDTEIDFVASGPGRKLYIQVAYLLADKATMEREARPLRMVKDNYPKFILSMDTALGSDLDGIRVMNLEEFLLSEILVGS